MNLASLQKLDRRWLFLLMGILTLVPMLFPLGLAVKPTAPVRAFHDTIAALPDGARILFSADFDPGSRPEMVPMMKTALRQLFDKQCRIVVICLWQGGSGIVHETLEAVVAEYRTRGQVVVYGRDYVDLGYKAGNEAVMVLMGAGFVSAFPQDQRAVATAGMPIMHEIRDYSKVDLLVNIGAGYPGTKEWVQQVNSRFHLPMVAGCTAVSTPEFYPYLQSGQLKGLLGGMAGAAEYEKLRDEKGTATRGMDAQSLAHVFVALCIVAGNVVQRGKSKGGRA